MRGAAGDAGGVGAGGGGVFTDDPPVVDGDVLGVGVVPGIAKHLKVVVLIHSSSLHGHTPRVAVGGNGVSATVFGMQNPRSMPVFMFALEIAL